MATGFTPGSPYHHSYTTEGNDPLSDTFHYTTHSVLGVVQYNDGKADAFSKVKQGLDVAALQKKATGWENVNAHMSEVTRKLNAAHDKIFGSGAWSGDDADKASKTFRDTTDSAANLTEYSGNLHSGTSTIAKAAAAATGTSSDGPSTLAQIANYETYGLSGFNGDGDSAQKAYFTLVGKINDGRSQMPHQLVWQTKTQPGAANTDQGGNDGSGGHGVGGVNGTGSAGSPAHLSARTPSISGPPQLTSDTDPSATNTGTDDQGLDTGYDPYDGSGTQYGNGTDYSPAGGNYSSAGAHGPGLDTGSSLAGYDPSGGAGGGGVGGLSAGGGGLGSGASGLGSAGGLDGSGALGAGAGGGLAGGAGAGAGANGRGGLGGQIAPMRGGGGSGGDESERERSTWLQEDDDVWGGSDAPPSVIS